MIGLLRNIFLQNFWPKFFCLVLAVLIWALVSLAIKKEAAPPSLPLGPTARRTFDNLPVMLLSSAADARTFVASPSRVQVTVRAETKILQSLQDKDIHVVMDVTGIADALDMRKRVEVSTPEGVSIVAIVPEEIQLTILPRR
jgi:YbbR domain-containing protein